MRAKPREVRQARAFLFNRGLVVSSRYCRVFVGTAKAMRVTFGQLDAWMREQMERDGARANCGFFAEGDLL